MGHRKSYYIKLFDFNIFLNYNFDLYLASLQCNALALKKGDHSLNASLQGIGWFIKDPDNEARFAKKSAISFP